VYYFAVVLLGYNAISVIHRRTLAGIPVLHWLYSAGIVTADHSHSVW